MIEVAVNVSTVTVIPTHHYTIIVGCRQTGVEAAASGKSKILASLFGAQSVDLFAVFFPLLLEQTTKRSARFAFS